MLAFLRVHERAITFSLVALCALWLTPRFERGDLFGFLVFFVIFLMVVASQVFWMRRALDLGERLIPGKPRRIWLAVVAAVVYLFFCVYSLTHFGVLHQWHVLTTGRLPVHAGQRHSHLQQIIMAAGGGNHTVR